MSVSGLCALCEAAPAIDQCRRCGSPACQRHFEATSKLCQECATAVDR